MRFIESILRVLAISVLLALLWLTPLSAQQAPQEWVPEVLRMPEDMRVLSDRSIGAVTRMFSIETNADVGALLDEWRGALDKAGYVLERSDNPLLDRQVQFSGPGIGNAKIVATARGRDGGTVIQFDASLRR